jgi:hypothetical protein
MHQSKFSHWVPWNARNELIGIQYPGVYALSISRERIGGNSFAWRREIVNIGMSHAISGLKGRLKQFDNTILGKTGHGGADRFRFKHPDYDKLVQKLFVAVALFKCDVTSNSPKALKTMGEVAKFEYLCLAHFVELFGTLPEFNDKKASRKVSK